MAATQLPNAFFNPYGQLGIYLGLHQLSNLLLPNNLASNRGALVTLDLKDIPADLKEGQSTIASWSEDSVNWIYNQLCQNIGDINTWILNASGDDASGIYDNISLANKDNRTILAGLTKSGIFKIFKSSNNLILSFAFSKQFQAYTNFFAQSGGTIVGAAATLEADKVGFFTKQGIKFIRLAKTYSQLAPDQQKTFNAKLADYKSQRGSDLVIDLIIVNSFNLVKADITHESMKDFLVDELIDNGDLVLWTILLFATDGSTGFFIKNATSRFGLRFAANLGVSFWAAPTLAKYQINTGLHEKLANTNLINNAANFMSQTYTDASTSAIVQNVAKHLAYLMETAGESSND